MKKQAHWHVLWGIFCLAFWVNKSLVIAQCVTAYPYHQTFENSAAWTTGGTGTSWAWGSPNKSVITVAGQGLKCWVTGGLTGTAYTNGERSWIQSPCFDFTNLAHPYIEFKIYWSSERKYDGGNLQYSLNNGTSWTNVGAYNDPVDCYTANWYNYTPINYLTTLATTRDGWSGTLQSATSPCTGGFGSGAWVVAKHCMSNLAGQPNVIFRFTFGAGTTCNTFDGIAIDDIYIMNAPKYTANFSWLCSPKANFAFTDNSTNCPNNWKWNFDDPSSGAANTSLIQNPTHQFSTPGIYNVQLIATNPCSGSDTVIKQIAVLGTSIDSMNVTCPGGHDAWAMVHIIGNTSTPSITWNTSPSQTSDTIKNLGAGTYIVTVSQAGTCSISDTFQIKAPAAFSHTTQLTPAYCNNANGAASFVMSGGTPYYTYNWQPNVTNCNFVTNILAGFYHITVVDTLGCIDTFSLYVPNIINNITIASNTNNPTCYGATNGSISLNPSGGQTPYSYTWTPSTLNGANPNNLGAGSYGVTVADAHNCVATGNYNLTQPAVLTLSPVIQTTTCGKNNGSISWTANGGTPTYTYSWNPSVSSNNSATNLSPGNYILTLSDSKGCTLLDTAKILSSTGPTISFTVKADTCANHTGKISLNVSGGASPYSFNWNPVISAQAVASGLASGLYKVIVTDAVGCKDSVQVTVPAINNTLAVTFSNQQNVSCFGGSNGAATAAISGGFTPYSYSWNPSVSNNLNLTNVQAGTYVFNVVDAGNCVKQASITITQPSALQYTSTVKSTSCAKNNGSIQVIANGGTPNYSFVWNPALSTNATLNSLSPGNYIMSLTDAKNCNVKDTFNIASSVDAQIALAMGPDTCAQGRGKVQVQVLSGNGPYNYFWTPGGLGTNISRGLTGEAWYNVSVQDAVGCTDTASVFVPVVGLISVSLGPDRELCLDETPVTLSVPAFQQIVWQDGSTGQNYAVHASGTYSVSVMNNYGCEAHDAMMVINLCEGWMMLPNAFSPNGDGLDDTYGPIFSNAANLIQYRMEIYNRWGQRVYFTADANAPWDGRFNGQDQEIGSYMYMIIYRFGLDTTDRFLKGDFTIIR